MDREATTANKVAQHEAVEEVPGKKDAAEAGDLETDKEETNEEVAGEKATTG